MIYEMNDGDLIPTAKTGGVVHRGSNVYLSGEARTALGLARETIQNHPAWMEALSSSTVIEFLCAYWLSQGELRITDFKAKTRPRGRPPGYNFVDNARPSRNRVD